MMNDLKLKCSKCKQYKSWGTPHKTCPECRLLAKNQKHVPKRDGLTVDGARKVVEYARSGMHDEYMAMSLKVPLDVFGKWRARGENSVDPQDPFYILYWDVNAARVEAHNEMLNRWKNNGSFPAQKAWFEYAFPHKKGRVVMGLTPNIPEKEPEPEKLNIQEIEYV